jgi:hypothetical protein
MSSVNRDVISVYGVDTWELGCWSGCTIDAIDRIRGSKTSKSFKAYIARMLSFAFLDDSKDLKALMNALNE